MWSHLWIFKVCPPWGHNRCGSWGLYLKWNSNIQKRLQIAKKKIRPWGTKVQPYPSLKKRIIEFMTSQQTITNLIVNISFQWKPKAVARKDGLVPLARPNRAKLSQTRRINVRKLPEACLLNWASIIGNSLTQEAKDAAQSVSTSLTSIQGSQKIDTPSVPSPTSPAAHAKITEHSKYCVICTLLGKICLEEFAMSPD